MGAVEVSEDVVAPPRGSALAAVAIMAGIALVAALAIVGWARFSGGGDTERGSEPLDAELPQTLAAGNPLGEVPPAIAAAVDAPVVGATRSNQLPAGLAGCGEEVGLRDVRRISVLLTPDAAIVDVTGVGEGFGFGGQAEPMPPPRPVAPPAPVPDDPGVSGESGEPGDELVRAECVATEADGNWLTMLNNVGPASAWAPSQGTTTWGSADGGELSTTTLLAPDNASWLVHDRGAYRLAYPLVVGERETVVVTAPVRGGMFSSPVFSSAVFLDATGTVLEEALIGG